jgi:choline dehydrogenase-like flavoprotein
MIDVVVVGSGSSGVNAAAPLVEAGCQVTLLDFGNRDSKYASLIPARPFREIRETDEQQHRYFLGDDFEGVPFGAVRLGAQLTPPRLHVRESTSRLMPVESSTFSALESLALGGQAAAWGAAVYPYNDLDLRGLPITQADLEPHYQAVAQRIGVSGACDDLQPFLGHSPVVLPPLDIDSNAETVMQRYTARRKELNASGFHLGRSRLAVCSVKYRDRGPHQYHDLDYWADGDRSVYRPRWTLDELERYPNFSYLHRRFVLRFDEDASSVRLSARHADSGEFETHIARALVLAAGTLGTARIVLRSVGGYGVRVPLVCNPFTYVPMLNLGMLGREARDRRHSLCQLVAIASSSNPRRAEVLAQFHSYRSLLTFKLLRESPLPYREGLRVMRSLMPAFAILGIQHEDEPSQSKYCVLRPTDADGPDRLAIHYGPSKREAQVQAAREKQLLRSFRRLGCWPIKRVRPGHGSSMHYAGTVPMSANGKELTCDADCRLAGTRAVYLADGSILPYLPAKGPTLTMMANADRVATNLLKKLP